MRPARVLVRVEALAEALERLAVGGDIGQLGGGRGDRVEAGEEGTADRPGQRTETGRLGEGHVAVRQGAGQAQDVGDGVQQQVRAAVEAGAVDDGAVLPDRDILGLGAVGAVPGEHGEVAQAVLAQWCGTARQGQVQGGDLVVRGAARVQDGHAVACGGDQLVVRGEHLLVRVLVGAVRREGEQVNDAGPELVDDPRARNVVDERLADALHPELKRVRHVGREVDEVDVVLDVIADHRAHGFQRARRGVEDDPFGQAREVLQQFPGELEAHGQQCGVELPCRGSALPSGPGRVGKAVGVPDDQGFKRMGHRDMIPEHPNGPHPSLRLPRRTGPAARVWPVRLGVVLQGGGAQHDAAGPSSLHRRPLPLVLPLRPRAPNGRRARPQGRPSARPVLPISSGDGSAEG